ncbi:hypothetical protein ACMZ5S_07455 [Streptococcus pluranimalium]
MEKPKIVEYNDAFFIDDQRIPFVVKNSVSLNKDDDTINITIMASSYERFFKNFSINTKELYDFKDNLHD